MSGNQEDVIKEFVREVCLIYNKNRNFKSFLN
jgi:hypothetical protein